MHFVPPIVLAFLAIVYVLIWQVAGTALIAPCLRRGGLSRGYAVLVAWLIFMPCAGAAAMAIAWLGRASAPTFNVLGVVLVLSGGVVLFRNSSGLRDVLRSLRRLSLTSFEKIFCFVALGYLAVETVFSAHPQRLYDQLDYHFPIAKRIMAFKGFRAPLLDPHLFIAGPVEYAMLWPRALVQNDLTLVGIGQVWVFLATALPVIASAYLTQSQGRRGLLAAAAATFVFPALVPNNEIAAILKPGAFLVAAAFILLSAPLLSRALFCSLVLPFVLLFSGCNPTFLHASLALGAATMIVAKPSWKELFLNRPLVSIAAAVLFLSLMKSLVLTGSFFYPSDAHIFGSPVADAETMAYWRHIAHRAGEPFWMGWLGFLRVPARNASLVAWVIVVTALAAWTARRKSASWFPRSLAMPGVFSLAYVSIWPFFYDGIIYSRFVAAYIGALLAGTLAVVAALDGRVGRSALVFTAALGLGASHLDVMALKLAAWNRMSAFSAFSVQFPRFATSLLVNRFAGPTDTVLADDGAKYFFDASVLAGTLSPVERATWAALVATPQRAAHDHRVRALVMEASHRHQDLGRVGPINQVWDELAPYGTELSEGGDLILLSDCYFAAKPCPDGP